MTTAILPATLTIGNVPVRQHDGLYSLNDLHKASGGEENYKPAFFLHNEQTKALISEMAKGADLHLYLQTTRGKYGSTYACKELVIAYAAWISAAFHLKVIRVFLDAVVTPALPPPVPIKTLTFTVPANDRTSRWLLHTDRTGREVVTELSPETHITTIDQLIHRLMVSPADLGITLSQMLTIIHACMRNVHISAGMYAKRLNIQPAKPTSAPRGQFSSMGIPPPQQSAAA